MKPLVLVSAFAAIATPALAQDCPEGQRPFAHHAGTDCIPRDPQRIVTLQDQNALLPLMELGVRPIASAGHLESEGNLVFRRMDGYDTTGIDFVGTYGQPDAEAVAAMNPDLIVASPWPEGAYETYSKIAPTIVIDMFDQPLEDALFQFADAVNRTERAMELQADVQAKADALRAELAEELSATTISVITADFDGGLFYPENGTQAAGAAFRYLDPVRTPAQAALAPSDWPELGWESLADHPGDVLFVTTYDGPSTTGEFDAFMALPVVPTLPVAQAGQVFELDGTKSVGSAWGKIEVYIDSLAAVLRREDLNRDLVVE